MNDQPADDFEQIWNSLRPGITAIFNREPLDPKRYPEMYNIVYEYCSSMRPRSDQGDEALSAYNSCGEELYDALKTFLTDHTVSLTTTASQLSGESLLKFYSSAWNYLQSSANFLNEIFAFFNRQWNSRQHDLGRYEIYTVFSLAIQIWKTTMFDTLELEIRRAVFEGIRKERAEETINGPYISTIIQSLIAMGKDRIDYKNHWNPPNFPPLEIYQESFEDHYLEETRNFYTTEVSKFLQAENPACKEYMKKVWKAIQHEENRASLLLHTSTLQKVVDVCNEVLITKQFDFMESNFGPLLAEKADDDITRMYNLCSRIPSQLDVLRRVFQDHITNEGQVALKVQEAFKHSKTYVQTILEVHDRYLGLVNRSFRKHPRFMESLDLAAIAFVNMNAVVMKAPANQHGLKSTDMVVKYCDGFMRKSSKKLDEMDVDVLQKKVMTIFKYLKDKDIFLKLYAKAFSNRLINNQSVSDEAETSLISKLRESCGIEYTSGLAKMVGDFSICEDLTKQYKENIAEREGRRLELNVKVLDASIWPSFPPVSLNLPTILSDTIESFKTFYDTKHNGRKLNWILSQSRGELVSSAFKGKEYVFGVTTAQMCTLLLFNEQTTYVVETISTATGMDAKATSTVLGSLIKRQVLLSDMPPGEDNEIPVNATISLNLDYTNKKVRVDLSKKTVSVSTAEDSETDQKSIDEDRKTVILACIVRIMKTRKRLAHPALMTEVIAQLNPSFSPKVEMIKMCIGESIDKGYIERNEEKRDYYDYAS